MKRTEDTFFREEKLFVAEGNGNTNFQETAGNMKISCEDVARVSYIDIS